MLLQTKGQVKEQTVQLRAGCSGSYYSVIKFALSRPHVSLAVFERQTVQCSCTSNMFPQRAAFRQHLTSTLTTIKTRKSAVQGTANILAPELEHSHTRRT